MENNIILFEPRNAVDAKANLLDFVELCRSKLKPFGREIVFEDNVWDISGIGTKAKSRYRSFLRFTRIGCNGNGPEPSNMTEPFAPFAKGLLAYMHAMKPTTGVHSRLWALRYLEAALLATTGLTCPTGTTPHTLNQACQSMTEALGRYAAYAYSKQLELIYGLMTKLRLVAVPSCWRTSVPACDNHRNRVGKDFDAERGKKLPSPAALSGLAQVFRNPKCPEDIVTSATCALMLCSPDRVSEVMHLPVNCIASERRNQAGAKAFGLRWFPAKGAKPMVKWIIPSMADIAREAIDKLVNFTAPARNLALWYEANPTRIFLPRKLEYLRGKELITLKEIGLILYDGNCGSAASWIWARYKGLKKIKRGKKELLLRFSDVESAVIKSLPASFPVFDQTLGMRFSEALFISRANELDEARPTTQCVVSAIEYSTFCTDVSCSDRKTIFDRHELREADGGRIRLTSHMLRHYLNTLAQAGGLSEVDIAMWSGRRNVKQNAAYNHVSDRDVVATLRKAVGDKELAVGPLAHVSKRSLVSRDEFANLKVVTAHTTEYGYCIHDFTMLPCQMFVDCLNCNEQVCIKGDLVRTANIRRQLAETEALLKKARDAMSDGDYGSDRWVQHQTLTHTRLQQLCTLLDDPSIPVGSAIQPTGIIPPSRIAQAAARRTLLDLGSAGAAVPAETPGYLPTTATAKHRK